MRNEHFVVKKPSVKHFEDSTLPTLPRQDCSILYVKHFEFSAGNIL